MTDIYTIVQIVSFWMMLGCVAVSLHAVETITNPIKTFSSDDPGSGILWYLIGGPVGLVVISAKLVVLLGMWVAVSVVKIAISKEEDR